MARRTEVVLIGVQERLVLRPGPRAAGPGILSEPAAGQWPAVARYAARRGGSHATALLRRSNTHVPALEHGGASGPAHEDRGWRARKARVATHEPRGTAPPATRTRRGAAIQGTPEQREAARAKRGWRTERQSPRKYARARSAAFTRGARGRGRRPRGRRGTGSRTPLAHALAIPRFGLTGGPSLHVPAIRPRLSNQAPPGPSTQHEEHGVGAPSGRTSAPHRGNCDVRPPRRPRRCVAFLADGSVPAPVASCCCGR